MQSPLFIPCKEVYKPDAFGGPIADKTQTTADPHTTEEGETDSVRSTIPAWWHPPPRRALMHLGGNSSGQPVVGLERMGL